MAAAAATLASALLLCASPAAAAAAAAAATVSPAPAPAAAAGSAAAAGEAPILGAIRWDAYFDWQAADARHGDDTAGVVGKTVQADMSPAKYHYRVPFFGEEVNETAITCNGDTDDAMAKELEFAANAGIKFWSFCNYPIGCMDYTAGEDTSNPHHSLISTEVSEREPLVLPGKDNTTCEKIQCWCVPVHTRTVPSTPHLDSPGSL